MFLNFPKEDYYQWDTGQVVQLTSDADLTEVHMHNDRIGGPALVQPIIEGENGRYVEIPDVLFVKAGRITLWGVTSGEHGGHTQTDCDVINVLARPKPTDYAPGKVETLYYKELLKRMETMADEFDDLNENMPEIEKAIAQAEAAMEATDRLAQYRRIDDSTEYNRLTSHIVENGFYNIVTSQWDDVPNTSLTGFVLLVFRFSPNYVIQIAVSQYSGEIYTRKVHRTTYEVERNWASNIDALNATLDVAPYSVYSNNRASLMGEYRAQSIAHRHNADGSDTWFIVGGTTNADELATGKSILVVSDNLYDWSDATRVEFNGYHCNDCVYNPIENVLVVVSGFADNNEIELPNILTVIDCESYEVIATIDVLERFGMSECHSIAYYNGDYIVYDRLNHNFYRVDAGLTEATVIVRVSKAQVLDMAHETNEQTSSQTGFVIGDIYYHVYSKIVYSNPVKQSGGAFEGALIAAISLTSAKLLGVSRFDWSYGREIEAAVYANGRLYWLVDGTYVEILESQPFMKRATTPVSQPIPAGADMDRYVSIGVYTCNSAATAATLLHCPITNSGFTLEVQQQGSVQVMQIFTPNSTTADYFVTRVSSGDRWGDAHKYKCWEALEERIAELEKGGGSGGNGSPGKDGVSPIVTTSKSGTVTTITITDAEGTKTATINDGAQGTQGPAGKDGAPGYTPVRGKDYWTDEDIAAINADNIAYISTELAKRGQLAPEFANRIEECTDTTKLYVLPDGYIYAYMLTEVESAPTYTNILPLAVNADGTPYVGLNGEKGYKTGWRLNSSKAEVEESGMCCTGFMPITPGSTGVLRLKNITPIGTQGGYLFAFGSDRSTGKGSSSSISSALNNNLIASTGVYELVITDDNSTSEISGFNALSTAYYIRLSIGAINENTIITWNEEITESETITDYAWANTGHAFVPADYENRIIGVEKTTAEHTSQIAALEKAVENGGTGDATEKDAYTRMKNWKYPIHEDAPVFLLETNKPAVPSTDWNTDAVYAKYDALMSGNSHYITKVNCGMASDGTTPIYVYHLTEPEPHYNGAWSETKPVILICSGVHPTEQSGVWSMYYALEEITTNPKLLDLRRNVHFIVMPMINPTGFTDSQYGVRNPDGIQVHYNFEVDFKYPTDSGYVAYGERNHGGETPLSIPETQYFDAIMNEYKDTLACVLSCHNNDVDTQWGTGFLWASCATHFMCNLGFRLVDKLSAAWREKHGTAFDEGVRWANEYALTKKTEGSSLFPNAVEQAEWDFRVGRASISGSGGTEYKQALKYGVHGINVEVCDRCMILDRDFSKIRTSNVTTMGAETYINFFRTFLAAYDPKDKKDYAPNLPWSE